LTQSSFFPANIPNKSHEQKNEQNSFSSDQHIREFKARLPAQQFGFQGYTFSKRSNLPKPKRARIHISANIACTVKAIKTKQLLYVK
jgi:hypothetical protein